MVRLYVVIFKCFAGIFEEWSGSRLKRFVHSFDADFLNRIIKNHRDQMNQLSSELDREAGLKTQDVILNEVAKKEDLEKMNTKHQQIWNKLVEMDNKMEAFRALGQSAKHMLIDEAFFQLLQDRLQRQVTWQPEAGWSVRQAPLARQLSAGVTTTIFSQQDLQKGVRHLGRFVQQDILQSLKENLFGLQINLEVYVKLREWNSKMSRTALWIEGPSEAEMPSQNTLTSASLVSVTQGTSSTSIFYFCQVPASPGAIVGDCTQGLVHAVYSLISQLVQYLPPEFDSDRDFSETCFANLDGSKLSLPNALLLMRDLLGVSTSPTYCIIDGIQFLENLGDSQHTALLQQFVGLLCGVDLPGDLILKTCFTTDGHALVLSNMSQANRVEQITYDLDAAEDRHEESREIADFVDEYD
jgi:hypothetical protein